MRKYRPGRKLSLHALTNRILRREYVFLGDKPIHPGFMGAMQFNTLAMQCHSGRVRAAIMTRRK